MSLGMSGADWQNLAQDYVNSRTYMYRNANAQRYGSSSVNGNSKASSLYAVSQTTGNTCTDGVDDGDIGVGSAVKSIAIGAGKGLLNCVVGCFTDDTGHFSLKKTLKSAGIAALCIAVPAVGAVACGVGLAVGATGVVNGIKNAHNATTDAAKKDALENLGDGAFTVAASAIGLKASVSAIKATSTAGKLAALEEAAESSNAAKAGMLGKAGQYAKALGEDMISSTKNNLSNIVNGFKIFRLNSKYGNLKFDPKYAKAEEIAGKIESATDALKSLKGKISPKNAFESAGDFIKNIPEQVKGIKLTDIKAKILKTPSAKFQEVRATLSPKAQGALDAIKEAGSVSNKVIESVVKDFGYANVIEALEAFAGIRTLDESI